MAGTMSRPLYFILYYHRAAVRQAPRRLHGARDLPCLKTLGANVQPAWSPVHQRPDALNIGRPRPLRLDVRMADRMADAERLATYFTFSTHRQHLPHERGDSRNAFILPRPAPSRKRTGASKVAFHPLVQEEGNRRGQGPFQQVEGHRRTYQGLRDRVTLDAP